MEERPVVVRDGSGNTAIFAIVAVVVIVAAILFFWQPWNTNSGTHNTTIIQPGNGAGNAAGSGGSGTSGGSGSGSTSGGSSSGGSGSGGSGGQ